MSAYYSPDVYYGHCVLCGRFDLLSVIDDYCHDLDTCRELSRGIRHQRDLFGDTVDWSVGWAGS